MQTVVETAAYLRAAKDVDMTYDEMEAVVTILAETPTAGDAIERSGGYRIVTFYSGPEIPAFLLTVFSKGERANLTKSEINSLKALTKALVENYATKVTRQRSNK